MFREYVQLLKFRYHISFLVVAGGTLLYARPLSRIHFVNLFLLYLCFNVLFYGGLYAFNDILDRADDGQHPAKRKRPLPSGRITVRSASLFAFSLVMAGVAAGMALFGKRILFFYAAFLAANLCYSTVAKNVPYVEFLLNACTYPLRFMMGVSFTNHWIPGLLVGNIFLLAIGVAATRRVVELKTVGLSGRKTLRYYSVARLAFLQVALLVGMVILALADYDQPKLFHSVLLGLYLVMVFGCSLPSMRSAYDWLWLR